MASEARLYSFSTETKAQLRKFRLSTSRSKDPQALIFFIDRKTQEIRQAEDEEGETFTKLTDVADALPDNTPRYILLSHPLTLSSGRQTAPYVLLSYLPATTTNEARMLYASARELMRNQSEASKVIEIEDAEEIEGVAETLKAAAEE